MDEGRDYIYVYQNELHQLYFQKLVEQLDNLQLGSFKFKTNICLNEIRSEEDAKVTTSATIEHATFTGIRYSRSITIRLLIIYCR